MKSFEENKAAQEAEALTAAFGENVTAVGRKKRVGHILHLVLGGAVVGASLLLHFPIITYVLCIAYIASGVLILNRSITG